MALGGIGRDGASPLDRFQQARDLARKKIDGDDGKARLADLLQKKQAELGGIASQSQGAARAAAPARKFELPAAAPETGAGTAGTGGLAAYGRGGAAEKPKAGPSLGRFIDLTA